MSFKLVFETLVFTCNGTKTITKTRNVETRFRKSKSKPKYCVLLNHLKKLRSHSYNYTFCVTQMT